MTNFALTDSQMNALLRCIFLAQYHTMCDVRGNELNAEKMLQTGWMVHEFYESANSSLQEIFPSSDAISFEAVEVFLSWIADDSEEEFKYYDE